MFHFLRALLGLARKTTPPAQLIPTEPASQSPPPSSVAPLVQDAPESPHPPNTLPVEKPIGLAFARALCYRSGPYDCEADCDAAIRDVTEAPAWLRRHPAALYNRGLAYLQKADHERAVADFTEAIRLISSQSDSPAPKTDERTDGADPKLADRSDEICGCLRQRCIAHLRMGRWQFAIDDATQALTLVPEDVYLLMCRTAAANELGDYDLAIVDSDQLIRLKPTVPGGYVTRGFAYFKKGEYDRAIADYSELIRQDPANPDLYEERGRMYHAAANLTRALEDHLSAERLRG